MKIFMSLILMMFLFGCGSSSSSGSDDTPSSPQTKDISKTPPSLPNI